VSFFALWGEKPGALWATEIENGGQAKVLFMSYEF
jgi:hypothetical protein